MRMKIYKILSGLLIFLALCSYTYAQNKQRVYALIYQQILPGGSECYYVIKDSEISVYKIKNNNKVLKCNRSLTGFEIDSIIEQINNIFSQNYNYTYSDGRILDGINWSFELSLNERKSTFEFSSCKLKPFEDLLKILNGSLPTRKRYISMEWLNLHNFE
jgi:hypothetical protein